MIILCGLSDSAFLVFQFLALVLILLHLHRSHFHLGRFFDLLTILVIGSERKPAACVGGPCERVRGKQITDGVVLYIYRELYSDLNGE